MTRAATFRTAAVVAALLMAALMIMTASRAAFTNPTSNDANYATSGSVNLTEATA